MGRWGEVEIINKCLRKNQGASIFMDTPLLNQLVFPAKAIMAALVFMRQSFYKN